VGWLQVIEAQSKKVERYHYRDYLSRAQQSLDVAKYAFEQAKWDACAIMAVQSAISASDALCTYQFSSHSSSQRHDDAIKLFRSVDPSSDAHKTNTNRLTRILSKKSDSAYSEQSVKRNEAEFLMSEAERLLAYVKSKLPQ